MPYKSQEDKNAANRRWRAKKAIEAGREPGRTGRPPSSNGSRKRTTEQRRAERQRAAHRKQVEANIRESKRKYAAERRKTHPLTGEARERQLARQRAWREKHAEEQKALQAWNQRRRRSMAYVEEAEEVVASVGVKPDGRSLYDDGLYDDALGAATLALMENIRLHKRERRAIAKTAVKNVLAQYKAETRTTFSLDAPVPGTDGLYFSEILEGDWY